MFEIIAIFVMLALIGIDQLTKWLAVSYLQGDPAVLWEGVFELRYVENDGMAWGLFGGDVFRWIVVALTAVLMVGLLYLLMSEKRRRGWLSNTALILIIAGGVGNLIDRVLNGYVVDFLYVRLIDFPVFNVADCFVVVGAILLIVYLLFFGDKQREKEPAAEEEVHDTADVDSSDRQDG